MGAKQPGELEGTMAVVWPWQNDPGLQQDLAQLTQPRMGETGIVLAWVSATTGPILIQVRFY